jgi:glutathione S-transferase
VYVLYGGRFTRALIVEMVLLEGAIPYELRAVDILREEHRSPEFLAVNPAGSVPALITPEGEVLHETPAINLYLAERHGLTRIAPRADEPMRGAFLNGLFYLADEFEPAMKRFYYPQRYVIRAEDAPLMKAQSLAAALQRLELIEGRLGEGGPYYLGDRFSLVDLTLAFWTANAAVAGALDPYPAIRRLTALTARRPRLRPKFDELTAWSEDYAGRQTRGEGVA